MNGQQYPLMGHANLSDKEEAYYNRINLLSSQCKEVSVFECMGIKYYGNIIHSVKEFIEQNPEPADFHVWLQDNRKPVKY